MTILTSTFEKIYIRGQMTSSESKNFGKNFNLAIIYFHLCYHRTQTSLKSNFQQFKKIFSRKQLLMNLYMTYYIYIRVWYEILYSLSVHYILYIFGFDFRGGWAGIIRRSDLSHAIRPTPQPLEPLLYKNSRSLKNILSPSTFSQSCW